MSSAGLKTIALSTVGSTGDVVPFLALALELQSRGHRVKVASHPFHAQFFEARNVEFVPVGPDFSVAEFNDIIEAAAREKANIKQFELLVRRLFLRDAPAQLETLLDVIDGVDAAVCARFDFIGQEVATRLDVPWASVTLTPQLIRTRAAPVYPLPNLGKWWTEFTWSTLESMAVSTNRHVSSVLKTLGAAPRELGVAGASSPYADLVAASEHLVQTREDWPLGTLVTGAWFLTSEKYEPPSALADFLDAHSRPIVVSFGSMGGKAGSETGAIILDALARVGRPAIVQKGYAGILDDTDVPNNVLVVGHVPHDYLFKQAGCIVHHAGAGTAHAVAESGVPSAPVPHLFDQYFWAGRLNDVGVAPKPLFRKDLTAKKLAKHIETAFEFTEAAERLGERVGQEWGVVNGGNAVEALIKQAAARRQ